LLLPCPVFISTEPEACPKRVLTAEQFNESVAVLDLQSSVLTWLNDIEPEAGNAIIFFLYCIHTMSSVTSILTGHLQFKKLFI
jgi:late competence protein required for DNA uptake (superfamily II DNA/RNA helicase)